jgi:hypothetical protein
MKPSARLKYKIVTSFAVAALAVVAIARLLSDVGFSAHSAGAFAVLAVLAVAAAWRGIHYLRFARQGAQP